MTTFIYLTANTVSILISAIQLFMFVRVILSLFLVDDGPILGFVLIVTEPVIFPVRQICAKLGLSDTLPIDIPFFITFLLLSFISMIL
ncbi:MAG: YggT family protein [Clostridia bacterium]|nr:YggT family protein [Clostridia bacterium]